MPFGAKQNFIFLLRNIGVMLRRKIELLNRDTHYNKRAELILDG